MRAVMPTLTHQLYLRYLLCRIAEKVYVQASQNPLIGVASIHLGITLYMRTNYKMAYLLLLKIFLPKQS